MVDENKWGIIYCPNHSIRALRRWDKIEKCLRESGVDFDFVQSENAGSVERLVRMLINNGYKTLIIVGGDSALNDAVNCLMQLERSLRDTIALGVIPNGLINDFAHYWGFREGDIARNVEWLKRHRVRKIDVGRIGYRNGKGEPCHRYFLNCVNVGLTAAIMNMKRRTRRYFFGSRTVSFCISFVLMLFQRLEYDMHLKINTDVIRRRVMTVCIGNAHGYGQTPNAVPYNGLLDVSVVCHPAIGQLFEGIYLFVRGRFLNHRSVHPYRIQELEILSAPHAMIGVDGRLLHAPAPPFKVRVEQEVVNFLIPD